MNNTLKHSDLNIVNIEDLEKLYDNLLPWEKLEFIEKHIVDSGYDQEQEEEDDRYDFDDIWGFVRDHDEDDILDEMSLDNIFCYLRDKYILREWIDDLQDHGKSYSRGYTDDEIINELELKDLDDETIHRILTKIPENVIKKYLDNK